jgi:hypothetical protein
MHVEPDGQLDGLPRSHPWEQYPLGKSAERRQTPVAHGAELEQPAPVGVPPESDEQAQRAAMATEETSKKRRMTRC